MSTKEQVLDYLYAALDGYTKVIQGLHPSEEVYREVFAVREGLKRLIMDIENGKYDTREVA